MTRGTTTADLNVSTLIVGKEQVFSDLDGEVVLLQLASGTYFGLDDVGSRIWHLIQEPRTVSAVRDLLVEEYTVEPDRCERDLLSFLQQLASEGLIEIRNDAPPKVLPSPVE